MRKIANTAELQGELQRLIAYAQTEKPSRSRIASELDILSQRVAADHAHAKAILDDVERQLKRRFPTLSFDRHDDPDLGLQLTVERKHREPDSSVCVIAVSEEADESSVSVHHHGSGSSHSEGPDFHGADAHKLATAAIPLIEKHVA